MNTFVQATCTYTRQRWIPLIVGGVVLGAASLAGFALDDSSTSRGLFLLTNLLGLPAIAAATWACSTAKWQFVNPRARLLPRFAAPHLASTTCVLLAAVALWPAIVAVQTSLSISGCVAYSMVLAALAIWGMHTFRQSLMFAGIAVMFAPAVGQLAPFWTGENLGSTPWHLVRLGFLGLGILLTAAWLWRLTAMTEEHDDYIIPAFGAAGQSRMEKSEFRRNVARQLSRGKIGGLLTDIWHNRIPHLPTATLSEKLRLLRYGFLNLPPLVIGMVFILPLFIAFLGVYSWFVTHGEGVNLDNLSEMILFQSMIFGLMPSIMLCQSLAARQPRLQQELMLPLSRQQFVGGLFSTLRRELVIQWGLFLCIVLAITLQFSPNSITYTRLLILPLAIGVGITLSFGLLSRYALAKSPLAKIVIMLVALYAAIAAAAAVYAVAEFVHLAAGLAIGVVLLAVAAATVRWAYRHWLTAELGL